MSESGFDRFEHIAATVNRLRMVQVDFADAGEDARAEYIAEQIETLVGPVAPADRPAFLAELMEQFPSWDAQVGVSLRKAESADRGATDRRELDDPNFLVARLIQMAPSLSERDRAVLIERLRETGLAAGEEADWSEQDRQQFRHALQLKDDVSLDLPRAMELAAMLTDFAARLDQLTWNAWRAIHPRSRHHRTQPLRELMGRLLRSDADVSRGEVKTDLDRLGGLLAAIISGVRQAGRQANQYLSRLSPNEIEMAVDAEGGNIFTSKDTKRWNKYVELYGAAGADTVDSEIQDAIAQHVESLMRDR